MNYLMFFILSIFSIGYLFSGAYILFKDGKQMMNRLFFIICLECFLWAFGYALMLTSNNIDKANSFRIISAIGWIFSIATWLDFCLALARSVVKKWKRVIIYFPSLVFFIYTALKKPVDVISRVYFGYTEKIHVSMIDTVYIVYYITLIMISFFIIWKYYRKTSLNRIKRQIKAIMISCILAFFLTAFVDTIIQRFEFVGMPIGIFFISIVILGLWHSIVKYRMIPLTREYLSEYVFEKIDNCIIFFDGNFNIKIINDLTYETLGYDKNEIDREFFRKAMSFNKLDVNDILREESIKEKEMILVRKDGKLLHLVMSIANIRDEFMDRVGLLVILQDMTKQKEVEKLLLDYSISLENKMAAKNRDLKGREVGIDREALVKNFIAQEEIKEKDKDLFAVEDIKSENELRRLNYELENTILKRTLELIKTNKELEDTNDALEVEIENSRTFEEVLQESEERFRATFEQAAVGICHLSMEGRFVRFNKKLCDILGYTPEELYNMRFSDLTYAEDIKISSQVLKSLIDGEVENRTFEKRYLRKDGGVIFAYLTISILRDAEGKPQNLISVVQDITEKKAMEAKLFESQANLRAIIESTNDFIWMVDAGDFSMISYNTPIERFFRENYNLEIEKGMKLHELIPEEKGVEWVNIYKRALEFGSYETEQTVLVNKNIMLLTVSPLMFEGKVYGISIFGKDITERKKYEEELSKAKRKAEAANEVKGQFLANMSHEIRTPINGIMGMIQLAMLTELTEEQKEYLETAMNSSSMLVRVVNDILDYSKIEAGRLRIENGFFMIRECMHEAGELFDVSLKQRNLKLGFTIDERIPKEVFGDGVRVKQVLFNLIGNAIKFTEKGGIRVDITLEEPVENGIVVRFGVTDTGIGISEEKVKELFQRFYQVDTSNTRKYGGTGLGLAISKNLVELMGGSIGVNSKVGEGSEFYFKLVFTSNFE